MMFLNAIHIYEYEYGLTCTGHVHVSKCAVLLITQGEHWNTHMVNQESASGDQTMRKYSCSTSRRQAGRMQWHWKYMYSSNFTPCHEPDEGQITEHRHVDWRPRLQRVHVHDCVIGKECRNV